MDKVNTRFMLKDSDDQQGLRIHPKMGTFGVLKLFGINLFLEAFVC